MNLQKIAAKIMADDLCQRVPAICHGNLGISRSDMPQIKSEKIPQFLDDLEDEGITVHRNQHIAVNKLKPTQKEMDTVKIQEMMNLPLGKLEGKPILVSKDDFIVDGHHRWAALLALNGNNRMPCHIISLPIRDLLDTIRDFDNVFKKDLNDKKVAKIIKKIQASFDGEKEELELEEEAGIGQEGVADPFEVQNEIDELFEYSGLDEAEEVADREMAHWRVVHHELNKIKNK